MEPISYGNTTECGYWTHVTFAPELGILRGMEWPGELEVEPNFGNGQPGSQPG